MITLFLSPSCTSCHKAHAWLLNHEVPFQEHNIMTSPLSAPELQHILSLTENGTDDIISTRSKIFQKLDLDVEDLSISTLIQLIEENPRATIQEAETVKKEITDIIEETVAGMTFFRGKFCDKDIAQ